jgi:hypothetical protein
VRYRLHQTAGRALHTLSVGPRILSGVLEEMARQVDASASGGTEDESRREREGGLHSEQRWPQEEEGPLK